MRTPGAEDDPRTCLGMLYLLVVTGLAILAPPTLPPPLFSLPLTIGTLETLVSAPALRGTVTPPARATPPPARPPRLTSLVPGPLLAPASLLFGFGLQFLWALEGDVGLLVVGST